MIQGYYEIMGGDCKRQSYWDGGADECLETCATLEEAREAIKEWHAIGYAAWISDENGHRVT